MQVKTNRFSILSNQIMKYWCKKVIFDAYSIMLLTSEKYGVPFETLMHFLKQNSKI